MPTDRQYRNYRRKSAKLKAKYAKRPISYNTVRQIAKKVLMKAAETKNKDWNVGKVEYYHNVPQLLEINSSSALPMRGDGNQERDGDKILKIGTRHQMLIGGKSDRTNITYRLTYITYPRDASYSYGNFFVNTTGNCMLDRLNTDLIKVIKTVYIKPQKSGIVWHSGNGSGAGDREYTIVKKVWLPSKNVIKFPEANSSESSNRKFGVLVSCYDAYGTLTSDNIAYIQHIITNYYKDT